MTSGKEDIPELFQTGSQGRVLLDFQAEVIEGFLSARDCLAAQTPRFVHQLPLHGQALLAST